MDDLKYYELHVTVAPDKVLAFTDFCKSTGAKPLYIQLDKGLHRNQLMVAVTHMLPDDKAAKGWASVYESYLKPHFTVLRTKLESRLTEGPNEYYEAHWKLDFAIGAASMTHYWDCTINNLVDKHPCLLRSHNLLDTRIHYLSQRIYRSVDPLAASETFGASGEIIKSFYGLPLTKTHYERCVWDSNPALDYGWHG
jgi:hypothetical protein